MPTTSPPMVHEYPEIFPDLEALRVRAVHGDLEAALAALPPGRPDAGARLLKLGLVADDPGLGPRLEDLLDRSPGDRTARTLRVLVASRGDDADVRRAERDLVRLCAEDPDDPDTWALRVRTAATLGIGRAETGRRYARAVELSPRHPVAHDALLTSLSPASGGSWDEALATARSISDAAPDGASDVALPATVLLRRSADPGAGDGLGDPDVAAELEELSDRLLGGEPTPYTWVAAHSAVGVALALADRPQRAVRHLGVLGPAMDPAVWRTVGGRHDEIDDLRLQALSHARYR